MAAANILQMAGHVQVRWIDTMTVRARIADASGRMAQMINFFLRFDHSIRHFIGKAMRQQVLPTTRGRFIPKATISTWNDGAEPRPAGVRAGTPIHQTPKAFDRICTGDSWIQGADGMTGYDIACANPTFVMGITPPMLTTCRARTSRNHTQLRHALLPQKPDERCAATNSGGWLSGATLAAQESIAYSAPCCAPLA